MQVGFVGTGNMGNPMALNILRAGHSLTVFDLRPEATANLVEQGAAPAQSPREVAAASEVTLLSMPTPAAFEAAMLGPDGVLAGAPAGSCVVDLTTNSPTMVQKVAAIAQEQGIAFLDAPVSGGVRGARKGNLAIMVGGDAEVLERCRPALEAMGDKLFHVGGIGMGNVAKLVNNMVALTNLQTMFEGFVLGAKAGMDPETLYQVMRASSGNSYMLEFGKRPYITRDWKPNFAINLAAKDIGLAVELGKELHVPLRLAVNAAQNYLQAQGEGMGDMDTAASLTLLERAAGGIEVRLREEPR